MWSLDWSSIRTKTTAEAKTPATATSPSPIFPPSYLPVEIDNHDQSKARCASSSACNANQTIEAWDNSVRDSGRTTSSSTRPSFFFPVYERFQRKKLLTWHTCTRLGPERDGLLFDIGAHDNLVGGKWVACVAKLAARQGLKVDKVKECVERARMPLALVGGGIGTYEAPV
eukprot:876606-Heterocapsa_arctica.AAC.1